MGATVQDEVIVTDPTGCGDVPSGSAAFTFFPNNMCAAPPSSPNAGGGTLSGGTILSNKQGPLTVGSYSFDASYTSTDPNFNNVTSGCEPLAVVSSISGFNYFIKGICVGGSASSSCQQWSNSAYGNPSGTWACHTDDSGSAQTSPPSPFEFSIPDTATCGNWKGATCPLLPPPPIPLNGEGLVQLSTKTNNQTDDYLVTATVTDNAGGNPIYEKVQGGLAASSVCYADSTGKCYTPVKSSSGAYVIAINPTDITSSTSAGCGSAIINLSSANTGGANNGNVVIWGNGSNATNQKGFMMTQGQVCQLKVIVRKTFSNLSNQCYTSTTPPGYLNPITSSWSEQQTGPGTFNGKSPYTGSLLVDVSNDGMYH